MNLKYYQIFIIMSFLFTISCVKNDTGIDVEEPQIVLHNPKPCEILQFGKTLRLKAQFTDNTMLKSCKINIHNNFDHHTHGNHEEKCELDEKKVAINPYINNWSISLPEQNSVDIDQEFELPEGFQPGDYHVLIYVTDINGNQAWQGVSVKIE